MGAKPRPGKRQIHHPPGGVRRNRTEGRGARRTLSSHPEYPRCHAPRARTRERGQEGPRNALLGPLTYPRYHRPTARGQTRAKTGCWPRPRRGTKLQIQCSRYRHVPKRGTVHPTHVEASDVSVSPFGEGVETTGGGGLSRGLTLERTPSLPPPNIGAAETRAGRAARTRTGLPRGKSILTRVHLRGSNWEVPVARLTGGATCDVAVSCSAERKRESGRSKGPTRVDSWRGGDDALASGHGGNSTQIS